MYRKNSTARKAYVCSLCGGAIAVGEAYRRWGLRTSAGTRDVWENGTDCASCAGLLARPDAGEARRAA